MRLAEAQQQGLTEDKVACIADFEKSGFSKREKLALAYTEAFLTAPESITDAFFDELKGSFTEAEIVEMSFFVGFFNTSHRFNTAVNLEPPDHDNIVVHNLKSRVAPRVKA